MNNRDKEYTSHTWSNKLNKILILLMYLALWLFGLNPFSKSSLIYKLFILVWCCEITVSIYYAIIYDIFGDEHSLNGLVNTILYIAHIGGHFAVLAESWKMLQYHKPLYEQFSKLEKRLESKLQKPLTLNDSLVRISITITIFTVLLVTCHGVIMWTTFKTKSAATLLYWRSLPSFLAIQFKTLEVLTAITQVNHYIVVIRKNINTIGERNIARIFKRNNRTKKKEVIIVSSLHQEFEDELQIGILKSSYNEIYATFQLLNKAYGWGLLASTAVYFVDFVCNTYWIILAVITQGRDYYALLQNSSFALLAFTLLSILCWLCEESYYQSRYIGCLISKLVKPLGNKHYNDLVSEFSVQTLHQRFVVTAKEFFSLNLNLLGSMVAAIVTYLVILIQFMFTEKSSSESQLTTKIDSVLISTTPMSSMDVTRNTSLQTGLDNFTAIVLTTIENSAVLTTMKSFMENITTTNAMKDNETLRTN